MALSKSLHASRSSSLIISGQPDDSSIRLVMMLILVAATAVSFRLPQSLTGHVVKVPAYSRTHSPVMYMYCGDGDWAQAFAVLGVQPGASRSELKAAYRARAKKCHPDVNPSSAAAEEFRLLTEVTHALGLRQDCSARPNPDPPTFHVDKASRRPDSAPTVSLPSLCRHLSS